MLADSCGIARGVANVSPRCAAKTGGQRYTPPSKNARGRFERFPPTHLEANMVTGFPITIGEALIIALLLIIIIRR